MQKIFDALQQAPTVSCLLSHISSIHSFIFLKLPDEARASTILHLETLSGVAKGLTRIPDGLSILESESDLNIQAEAEKIRLARDDPSATKLREVIFAAIRGVVELWSVDAGVGNVRPCFYSLFHTLNVELTMFTTL